MIDLVEAFYNRSLGVNTGFDSKYVKVVRDNQTVQQVLDSITDASETKQYLVLVPPGHELEYFDWKPYVTVKFLDNLEERWKLDDLEGWDELDNWQFNRLSAELEPYAGGSAHRIKMVGQEGVGLFYMKWHEPLDLRKYQGIMFDLWFENSDSASTTGVAVRTYFDGSNWVGTKGWSNHAVGSYQRTVFLPFGVEQWRYNYLSSFDVVDWSNVSLRLRFYIDVGVTVKIANIRLVRTCPYPAIFLRTDDDEVKDNFRIQAIREVVNRGYPIIWAVVTHGIYEISSDDRFPPVELLRELESTGFVNIVNHSVSHPKFSESEVDEKETIFQVEASRYFYERLGFKSALNWWAHPYVSTSPTLDRILDEYGYLRVEGKMCGTPISEFLSYGNGDIPQYFYPLKKGGIQTLLFHHYDLYSEEGLNQLLSTIDNLSQYCRFIGLRDIERMMNTPRATVTNRQQPTLFQVLDSDFKMRFYHKQVFLDPNGTDRNINIKTYMMRPGDTFLIVNTGTSGRLIVDPGGLNKVIDPGQAATFIYY